MGINAANSKYPCELNIQSEANSNEVFIQRSSKHSKLYYGKTSRQHSKKLKKKSTIDERKGYINNPLFSFIKFKNIIFDSLVFTFF